MQKMERWKDLNPKGDIIYDPKGMTDTQLLIGVHWSLVTSNLCSIE